MGPRKKEGAKRSIPHQARKGSVPVPERLKVLDQLEGQAVLATESEGQPYTSLVSFALLPSLKGAVFATTKATFKYRNIRKNGRVALFIDNRSKGEADLLEAEAVTILGTARPIRRGKRWKELARILTQKHPSLTTFVRDPSTALVLIEAAHCLHVSRFQTISRWDVA